MFRTIKFAKNEGHLAEITAKVIPYLTCALDITPQEDWITGYSDIVKESLSEQRGYVQGEMKKRCQGTSDSLFLCILFVVTYPEFRSRLHKTFSNFSQSGSIYTKLSLLYRKLWAFGTCAL